MGKRHPDFYCIAGANTVGTGLSRQYVGRNQLDAASIDRFVMIDLPYDAHLEAKIVGADCFKPRVTYTITPRELTSAHSTRIFEIMWAYRENIDALALQHVVSPRATMAAIKLYAAGWAFKDILEAVVRKGLPVDAWGKLNSYQIQSMCGGL
jgi:cobaltochelatase CobS